MRPVYAIFISFCLILPAFPVLAAPPQPAVTDAAQQVYETFGDAVYQIQVIDLASGKKSGIGSGFQFTKDGLIATNYHVIASALRRPEANRVEFLHDHYGTGTLKIRAADVVHDLAILEMETPGDVFVSLGTSDLRKGTRLFALGNPHDISFTIVEGTYNGPSKDSFINKIHFSGALNPGMSGGPALTRKGRVAGINVATAGNQIGFLVPVEALKALMEQAEESADKNFPDHAHRHIEAQIAAQQDKNIKALLDQDWESMHFGPLMMPGRIHDVVKCWGDQAHEEKDEYLHFRSVCSTQDRIFIDDNFHTSTYSYHYEHVAGKQEMKLPRFYAFYKSRYGLPPGAESGTENNVTNYDCHTDFVLLAGRKWKASYCVRQYRKYKSLYDLQLNMAMLGHGKEGMLVALKAHGLTKENALALAKRFLGEIREAPRE